MHCRCFRFECWPGLTRGHCKRIASRYGSWYHLVVAQRVLHYEQAFEAYLRQRRVPYVSVDDARKSLLPEPGHSRLTAPGKGPTGADVTLKSFDFVIYGDARNLLVEVKGRKIVRSSTAGAARETFPRPAISRLQTWVMREDVESLQQWEALFGPGFEGVFVFMFWCDGEPPQPLFEDIFDFKGRWYAVRVVDVTSYAASMRVRSVRWQTVHLPSAVFDRISGPLFGHGCGGVPGDF